MSAPSQSTEVYLDFSPHLYVYTDGRLQRLSCIRYEPASKDHETRVLSEDSAISPDTYMTPVRIYVPPSATPGRKLPLLVYYHGGGFMAESTFSPLYHRHLNYLASVANVLIVSVEYKLAPEYYLPIAYEESWLALQWVASQSKTEDPAPWIREFADFDRVYLGGDSAGANIAHYLAMRVASERLEGIHLRGMFLNCPYFWGKELIGNEVEYYARESHFYYDRVWICCFPTTPSLDDPRINPGADPEISWLGCKRVLVFVGGLDPLRDRGLYYKEVLEKSEWAGDVEIVDVVGEDHVWSVFDPTSVNGMDMLKRVSEFLNHLP